MDENVPHQTQKLPERLLMRFDYAKVTFLYENLSGQPQKDVFVFYGIIKVQFNTQPFRA